jgi:hypothetical protein
MEGLDHREFHSHFSSDAGFTVHQSNPTLSAKIDAIAGKLNLRPHICGLNASETKKLSIAVDVGWLCDIWGLIFPRGTLRLGWKILYARYG